MSLNVAYAVAFAVLVAAAFPSVVSGQNGTLVDNSTSCDPFAFRATYNSTYDTCQCEADFTGNGTHCTVNAQLDCSSSPKDTGYAFKVYLNQTYIDYYYDWTKLRLNNESCNNVTLEGGYYTLSAPEYDDCGSVPSNSSDNIIYSNAVLSNGGGISSGAIMNLPFTCFVTAFLNLSLSDDNDTAAQIFVDKAAGASTIVFPVQQADGSVSASLYLYKDENYATVFNGVPILSTTDVLYVKIALDTVLRGVYIVSKECWATPDAVGTSSERFDIIESPGCLKSAVTKGKVTSNGVSEESRFQLQVFRFMPTNVVYLHCMVQLCMPTSSGSCEPTCLSRRRRTVDGAAVRKLSSPLIIRSLHHLPEPLTTPVTSKDSPAGGSLNDNEDNDSNVDVLLLPILISLVAVLAMGIIALLAYIFFKNHRRTSSKINYVT